VGDAPIVDGHLGVAENVEKHRDELLRVYGEETWRVYEALDRSLEPRGPDSLLELAGEYLQPGSRMLDAGCRDAAHLIRLVQLYDATGVGVDPVPVHVERAKAAVAAAGLDDRIEVRAAGMHDLPFASASFDFVWCRDVVEQVVGLVPALRETARVLEPDGRMLVFTTFVTDRLAAGERAMLDRHRSNVPENLLESNVEAAFAAASLTTERKEVIGTEWREYAEERTQPVSRALLRLSRLRRRREELIARFGDSVYEHVEANLHWEVFQFLGKLQPTVYLLGVSGKC
jgi:cyclopropane fatty-acyl-phospholipid synthase-like methyltransferase